MKNYNEYSNSRRQGSQMILPNESVTKIESPGFLNNKPDGYQLIKIPGGEFMMGPDYDWRDKEIPPHKVRIDSFYMGKYPVTNKQYAIFLKETNGYEPTYWKKLDEIYKQKKGSYEGIPYDIFMPEEWKVGSSMTKPNQPIVGMIYYRAKEYADWAGLRLPTEAEWEYACRAGTTTKYHSGDLEKDLGRVGWYEKNSDFRLHIVGEKEPNAFGLYDMHGNVWEICQDFLGMYSGHSEDNPTGPEHGFRKVSRGGGWYCNSRRATSYYRDQVRIDCNPFLVDGFRLCKSL